VDAIPVWYGVGVEIPSPEVVVVKVVGVAVVVAGEILLDEEEVEATAVLVEVFDSKLICTQ
jgi:hypothetical protein